MGHDVWLESLRRAAGNPDVLERLLAEDLPTNVLQHVGETLLGVLELAGTGLSGVVDRLVGLLRERRWDGDEELAYALGCAVGRSGSSLVPLFVELDEVGEALSELAGSENWIDLQTGMVWLHGMSDFGMAGDLDMDFSDETRWLFLEGEGSQEAYRDLQPSSPRSLTSIWRRGSVERSRGVARSGVFVPCSNTMPPSSRGGIASMPTPVLVTLAAGLPITATKPALPAARTSRN